MTDVEIDADSTALLITDPQIDFLKPDSVVWDKVGETVEQNAVVEKLVTLREAARERDVPVIYSPHEYTDDEFESWEKLNTIDQIMFDTRMFDADGRGATLFPNSRRMTTRSCSHRTNSSRGSGATTSRHNSDSAASARSYSRG